MHSISGEVVRTLVEPDDPTVGIAFVRLTNDGDAPLAVNSSLAMRNYSVWSVTAHGKESGQILVLLAENLDDLDAFTAAMDNGDNDAGLKDMLTGSIGAGETKGIAVIGLPPDTAPADITSLVYSPQVSTQGEPFDVKF